MSLIFTGCTCKMNCGGERKTGRRGGEKNRKIWNGKRKWWWREMRRRNWNEEEGTTNFRDQKTCPVAYCTVRYASCVCCRFVQCILVGGRWRNRFVCVFVCVCVCVCVCVWAFPVLQHAVLGMVLTFPQQVTPPLINKLTVDRPLNSYQIPLELRMIHSGHLDTKGLALMEFKIRRPSQMLCCNW